MDLKGKKAVVYGAARSGLAALRALARHGARVTLTDRRGEAELAAAAREARALGAGLALGGHPAAVLDGASLAVLSPGVPGNLPGLAEARRRGCEVLGEIELAFRLAGRDWLAVSGTNGKTTTTAWLAEMMRASGRPLLLGGNIGSPLADRVEGLDASGCVVAEVSSFQLEETGEFRPRVAVLTNLTPDHLDRYPDMGAYAAAKARIFGNQGAADWLVLNAADGGLRELARPARSRRLLFSRQGEVEQGTWLAQGALWLRLDGAARRIQEAARLRLRGPHNLENALAAACAAAAAGADAAAIARALEGFQGVEHRLEPCGQWRGVRFINDSKATNVDSVAKALQSFDEPLRLILGGRDKEGDFRSLRELIARHVVEILLLGEAADKIAGQLEGAAPMRRAASLQEALRLAAEAAGPGEVVLLSPGCASFDMFENYEHRGRAFKEAAAALMERSPA